VRVNGNPITQATFNHWMDIAAASTLAGQTGGKPVLPEPPAYTECIAHLKGIEPKLAKLQKPKTEAQLKTECEQQYKAYRQQVLGFLISLEWVFGEAEEHGVKVTDAEVAKHLNELKRREFAQEAKFQKFLTATDETVADLLLRVKLSMVSSRLQEKITKSHKNVSEAEVAKYYEAHKAQYGQPERRDLRLVLTKAEAQAKQAKQEIQSGKSFASVAKSKSIDPTSKNNGGELPGVIKGEEQKAFSEAVFAASKGVLSGPVKTPFGYYVFEVKATHLATQQSLAQVKTTIKRQLQSSGGEKALEKFSKELKATWQPRTECRAQYMVKDCKGYKAPKTSTTGAE
jgi:foldase protein PrsA